MKFIIASIVAVIFAVIVMGVSEKHPEKSASDKITAGCDQAYPNDPVGSKQCQRTLVNKALSDIDAEQMSEAARKAGIH